MKLPTFNDGTLTALKWLALALMTIGHVDWFLYGSTLGVHHTIGRLVFPITGFVVGYNLARPTVSIYTLQRVFFRLMLWLGITMIPYSYLIQSMPWHLNILGTFSLAVALIWLIQRGWWIPALLAFLWGGMFVDYGWQGVGFIVAVWFTYSRQSTFLGPALVGFSITALEVINGNYYALWALPLLWVASYMTIPLPRNKWAFYLYYLGHLVVLAFILAWFQA